MLSRPRGDAGTPAVVHAHLHPILSGLQERRQIRPERRIPSFMRSCGLSVHRHLRHLEGCAAIQKNLLPHPFLRHHELLAVGAAPRVKGIGHEIGQAERMGQMRRLPAALSGLVFQPELPAAVPDHPLAGGRSFPSDGNGRFRSGCGEAQNGGAQHVSNHLAHEHTTRPRHSFFQSKNIPAPCSPATAKPCTPSGLHGWKKPSFRKAALAPVRYWVMIFNSATVALCSPPFTGERASSLK